MTAWQGPQATPSELGIDTPLPYVNASWKIAVDLLDEGRRLYREGRALRKRQADWPGGFPGAWLPVSLGRRAPLVHPWDERDIRHAAKMMTYLWADEPGLFGEYERNLFVEQIRKNGDYETSLGNVSPFASHWGMYMLAASDLGWCHGVTPAARRKVLGNIVKLVRRTRAVFDPEGSGFLNVGACPEWHQRCFWGMFLGEYMHFPPNFDGRNKLTIAGMAMAVFTKRFRDAARELDAPEADALATCHDELVEAIETRGWNDRAGYYYLQRDDNSDRWYMSMNGLCEESRETDVVPCYAAEVCGLPERVKAVGRVLEHALLADGVFPLPTRYPLYTWYAPSHPNYNDAGDDCGPLGSAWDTPYFHCVQTLERLGLQKALQRAVFRRAEVIHRDNDCLEHYCLDGAVDHTRYYCRDRYIVGGTAHLSALIEGLFGITPARPGFAEVNLRPNLPLFRRYHHSSHPSDWSGRDNRICVNLGLRGRLEMVVRYDEDKEMLTLRTSNLGIPAHIRLPLDLGARFRSAAWNGKPVKARMEKGMDTDFVHVDHRLDGGTLTVKLAPHPQKGKGGTPMIDPRASVKN